MTLTVGPCKGCWKSNAEEEVDAPSRIYPVFVICEGLTRRNCCKGVIYILCSGDFIESAKLILYLDSVWYGLRSVFVLYQGRKLNASKEQY